MCSTSFQASAGSASVSKRRACEPSRSAKSIRTAKPSCASDGPACKSTKTCASSTDPATGEQLTLFAADTLASPSAWQDAALARKMKDTSGRKCCALYEAAGRDGSLPKTLLGILRSVSTRLPHRWKLKASPSGRLYFQLALLALPTGETDFGLWLTPRAKESSERPETFLKRMGDRSARCRGSLTAQVMWPTPKAHAGSNRRQKPTPAQLAGKAGMDLSVAVKLWPTPHGFSPDGKSNGPSGNELGRAVNQSMRLLASPTAQDAPNNGGASQPFRNSSPLNAAVGGSLNPMWVEWLMGYPIGWTGCALSATPSSRKSRRSSDKPS